MDSSLLFILQSQPLHPTTANRFLTGARGGRFRASLSRGNGTELFLHLGSLTSQAAGFLHVAVRSGHNVLVTGATSGVGFEIARALASRPVFMLLDEPFAGIDPITVKDIQDMIVNLKKTGIGVIITDHNVKETLKICDRAYIIHQGLVIEEGTPEKVVENDQVKQIYVGRDFSLI